jgi:hypothetical protein
LGDELPFGGLGWFVDGAELAVGLVLDGGLGVDGVFELVLGLALAVGEGFAEGVELDDAGFFAFGLCTRV